MATRTLSRRRRRYDENDEPEEDDTTTSGSDEEEEDDRPRGRRGSRSSSSKSERPSGRSRRSRDEEDEEEDDKPRRRNRAKDDEEDDEPIDRSSVKKGWDAVGEHKSGDYPDELEITDEAILIKLLDDEPFAVYQQHWIQRSQGKKSWTCLEKKCPLCDDLGDKPRTIAGFNVVEMTEDGPTLKVWYTGPLIQGILKNFTKDKKTSPLNREDLYFSVSKSKKKKKSDKVQYFITPVKERDVAEDWGVDPLSDKELDEFDERAYDESIVYVSTRKQLLEIVDEVNDED